MVNNPDRGRDCADTQDRADRGWQNDASRDERGRDDRDRDRR